MDMKQIQSVHVDFKEKSGWAGRLGPIFYNTAQCDQGTRPATAHMRKIFLRCVPAYFRKVLCAQEVLCVNFNRRKQLRYICLL